MVVSYFTKRGTINILGGSPSQLKAISEFIAKNDVKQPQALMDITILELSENGAKSFTNEWYINSPNFSGSFMNGTTSNTFTETTVDADGKTKTNIYKYPILFGPDSPIYGAVRPLGPTQVRWLINYAVTNTKGRVVANPKIMLTNGEPSNIDLTEDYVEKVDVQYNENSSTTQPIVNRTYNIAQDQGLQFTITPFISPEGYLSIDFDAEYSTEKGYINDDLGNRQVTLLNRRTVNLKNVRIKDNETLIIGGLMKETDSKTVSKIPFLGDIPIIGTIFRSSSTTKDKSELVIMLTPKILKDAEDIGVQYNSNYNDAL